jgi:hypothetical protein
MAALEDMFQPVEYTIIILYIYLFLFFKINLGILFMKEQTPCWKIELCKASVTS